MKALFVSQPARAFGEINVLLPLSEEIMARGGQSWFLVSPLAADVARRRHSERTFELSSDRSQNQILFWRLIRKLTPDLIIFSAFHELLHPRRRLECPLIDKWWLKDICVLGCTFVFMDFIAHVPALHDVLGCPDCSGPVSLAGRIGTAYCSCGVPQIGRPYWPSSLGLPFTIILESSYHSILVI
jgi:hypothetical protein